MKNKIIQTDLAPQAIGPYSQGVLAGQTLYVSGQIPLDPSTGQVVAGGVQAQTKQCLLNLQEVIKAAGGNLHHVVKTTVFIKDMNDFGRINDIYGQYFTDNYPARACVEVARLPKDVLVEIEAIVVL